MSRLSGFSGTAKWLVPALAVLGLWPAGVQAASLGFRNDLNVPIVIQSVIVVNKQNRMGKPLVLLPGEVSLDPVPAGERQIIIRGARRPKPLLLQDNITIKDDLFLSVQFDAKAGKVKLVPTKMPMKLQRPAKQDPTKK